MKKRYEYRQNNSGGSYDTPEWTGPEDLGGVFNSMEGYRTKAYDVWVLAESGDEADSLAQKYAGVYFNGCEEDIDCDCCGDRWYSYDAEDEEE